MGGGGGGGGGGEASPHFLSPPSRENPEFVCPKCQCGCLFNSNSCMVFGCLESKEQWNGIVEWNTGISFNCIFVSLGYFPALQIFLKDVVRISNSITDFPYDFVHDINL